MLIKCIFSLKGSNSILTGQMQSIISILMNAVFWQHTIVKNSTCFLTLTHTLIFHDLIVVSTTLQLQHLTQKCNYPNKDKVS